MAKKPTGAEKGAAYERLVCQRLSLWVSRMTREDCFWRSSMSGGRATLASRRKRGRKFDAHSGDISATHAEGGLLLEYCVVECKFYKDLQADRPIWAKGGYFIEWMVEPTWEMASEIGKHPLLIARQNRKPDLICTTTAGKEWLERGTMGPEDFLPTCWLPRYDCWIFLFSELLTELNFDEIRDWYAKNG